MEHWWNDTDRGKLKEKGYGCHGTQVVTQLLTQSLIHKYSSITCGRYLLKIVVM
jgi:hypothetical protein